MKVGACLARKSLLPGHSSADQLDQLLRRHRCLRDLNAEGL